MRYLSGPELWSAKIDLLKIKRGSVTAPAGCGKTHLIADALVGHAGEKPILILTHTNAGVAALRQRLRKAGVVSKAYRLSTIDGWVRRIVATFPTRSDHDPRILELINPSTDYPSMRRAAGLLLSNGHINDILEASYAHLIVDEYQDCTDSQHAIISCVAEVVPTCVLGDPMQAIFGFGSDSLPSWTDTVCRFFPVVGELTKPWRWINAGSDDLGAWLLVVRRSLYQGDPVDLGNAPNAVQWVQMDGIDDRRKQLRAARAKPPGGQGSVLIIADSRNPSAQRTFASQIHGAVTVEAVDLRDFISFARSFKFDADNVLGRLAEFAQTVMANVGAADLIRRVDVLARGTARKKASEAERAALTFREAPSANTAIDVLVELNREPGVRVYRPAVLRACIKALKLCSESDGLAFYDAAIRVREENRILGRALPKRAVGSTLLLKGLEAEVAVVLSADDLDRRNLYVAMTRGSKGLVICSTSPVIDPA